MTHTYDLIVRGGEVANHAGRGMADVGVRDGRIAFIGDLSQASAGEVVDATGLTVLPGVIDTQVHFREPGLEWKEDLETGSPRRGPGRGRRRVRDAEHQSQHHRPGDAGGQAGPRPRPDVDRPRLLHRRHPRQCGAIWASWSGCPAAAGSRSSWGPRPATC